MKEYSRNTTERKERGTGNAKHEPSRTEPRRENGRKIEGTGVYLARAMTCSRLLDAKILLTTPSYGNTLIRATSENSWVLASGARFVSIFFSLRPYSRQCEPSPALCCPQLAYTRRCQSKNGSPCKSNF